MFERIKEFFKLKKKTIPTVCCELVEFNRKVILKERGKMSEDHYDKIKELASELKRSGIDIVIIPYFLDIVAVDKEFNIND